MHRLISGLIMYRHIEDNNILSKAYSIFEKFDAGEYEKNSLIFEVNEFVNAILDISTTYGFKENLWHNYLTYLIVTNENPFSITCERKGIQEGSVNNLVKHDFKIFKQLFDYDFSAIQKALDTDCFDVLCNYISIEKNSMQYNKNVSEKVVNLSRQIEKAADENEIFDVVTSFYEKFGVGMFGLNKAFRITQGSDGSAKIIPITNIEHVGLDTIIGYESQKSKLVENTKAFVMGRQANNTLLYGDSGTGKSTAIKAILNEFYDDGLRIIEIYKHQFKELSNIISQIKSRNYKFIIYMDDLSFEEFEIEYKYLKAVIEGGLEIKPSNVLIYATSNRRHLIKETWSDRSDGASDDMHRNETMAEKMSLVNRFGVLISFIRPDKKAFNEIVLGIARRYPQITLSDEELIMEANKWELSHAGMSGRCATQFVTHLLSTIS